MKMSRNAKIILIAVLAVVLVGCMILAIVLPRKDAQVGPEGSGESGTSTVQTTEGAETTEGTGAQEGDATTDVENPDSTTSDGKPVSGGQDSSGGNDSSGGQNSNEETPTDPLGPVIEIDFEDLLNGAGQGDKNENKNESAGTEATEPEETKPVGGNVGKPVEGSDSDITIYF